MIDHKRDDMDEFGLPTTLLHHIKCMKNYTRILIYPSTICEESCLIPAITIRVGSEEVHLQALDAFWLQKFIERWLSNKTPGPSPLSMVNFECDTSQT